MLEKNLKTSLSFHEYDSNAWINESYRTVFKRPKLSSDMSNTFNVYNVLKNELKLGIANVFQILMMHEKTVSAATTKLHRLWVSL